MPYKEPDREKEYKHLKHIKDMQNPEYVAKRREQWKKYNDTHKEEHKQYAQQNKERIKVRCSTPRGKLITLLTDIKKRCYNPNSKSYKDYGARGIIICEEWLNDSEKFYEWAFNNGYSIGLTIDRIDVNGNYCPENCRFISRTEQNNNKRNNAYYEYASLKMTFHQWGDYLNFDYKKEIKILENKSRIKKDKNERIEFKHQIVQNFIENKYNEKFSKPVCFS